MTINSDFINEIKKERVEIRTDPVTRTLYSTDASIYQIEPSGVVFPRDGDQISATLELAAKHRVPIIARGSGSGLAGQAIGPGLIVDCSRHLDRLINIDPEEMTATVQPGLVLTQLNRAAGKYGLLFGPDPASADRATLGGVLSNNATGAHSILYGMAADHLLEVEVVLSDGSVASFYELPTEAARRFTKGDSSMGSLQSAVYTTALDIREKYASIILENWPKVWRRSSGYNLNYLLPWSPSVPPQWQTTNLYPPISVKHINLAPLFAGAEGTLGVIRQAKIRLVPKPKHTILGVLSYKSIASAADDTPRLLEQNPSAVELIPRNMINLARSVPAYARMLSFVQGDPAALLVVEFAGDNPDLLDEKAASLGKNAYLAQDQIAQAQVWNVRKVGLGLLMSIPGDAKPIAFIEDITVPVESLGEYVRVIENITAEYGIETSYYAHASAGCLHIRPLINLKEERGVKNLRTVAEQAISAGLRLGGIVSGEHGDGLARSEFLIQAFGPALMEAQRLLKDTADPQRLLNPGKIIDPPKMDKNLRFGVGYQSQGWQSTLSFDRQVSLEGAIEMCNGAGVCLKSEGVMCPTFQAGREEMHSTRGRANLLRALISNHNVNGQSSTDREQSVYEALDLCLACKGCKSECPSAVDVAKLKYEFLNHYYQSHSRKIRDYLFGYIDSFAIFGQPFSKAINGFMENESLRGFFARIFRLSPKRKLPRFARYPLPIKKLNSSTQQPRSPVLLLLDPFTRHFYPGAGEATMDALRAAGYSIWPVPVHGAGRTLISKGFLKAAKRHAEKLVAAINELDPDGVIPIVGIEPSEIYTLSDEYPDFFPGDPRVAAIAKRAWMIDEFLIRPNGGGIPRISTIRTETDHQKSPVLLHGHCYQKARPPADDGYPVGVDATVAMLQAVGYEVEVIDAGCCGMAGAFGYEADHYELSMQIGEMKLFPAVRNAGDEVIVAACGVSCQAQIEDGAQRVAVHPITLLGK
jgi:FAD/FMN-containing dehydrogenase/Fe-S oxidoreductase